MKACDNASRSGGAVRRHLVRIRYATNCWSYDRFANVWREPGEHSYIPRSYAADSISPVSLSLSRAYICSTIVVIVVLVFFFVVVIVYIARYIIRGARAGNINSAVLLCHLRFIPTVNGTVLWMRANLKFITRCRGDDSSQAPPCLSLCT